ncbi:SDR family oxidoreductase [Alicyclobacillus ferrooxydans]|uniref:Short-chain dehydrogenase n=1 Tax=Alicyclobacillus ferrooxydans TaxID=471514 RepID=A0A0P9CJ13_9BACL|nr:SDR family NAD(P)-dependent oxidoreductase [Alicyclobacillus ferrooxydans]KPV45633.1 hypothetical protein AN477_01585 [Alicyclobacillus ferrooxydans]
MPKTAIVTGASSGIGRSIAELLASKGYNLVVLSRRKKLLEQMSKEIMRKHEVAVEPYEIDIADPIQVKNTSQEVLNTHNKIDVLVNAAGHGKGVGRVLNISDEDVVDQISTNLTGTILLTKSYIKHMEEGHIIFIGSIFSSVLLPDWSIYSAAKHGLLAFSKTLRTESKNTKVTVVDPGSVDTDFIYTATHGSHRNNWPYKPLDPGDIAETVHWILCQPQHVEITHVEIKPWKERQIP